LNGSVELYGVLQVHAEFRGRRILLLQGPVGPFFSHLCTDLEDLNATVFKVNFNGGDATYYPDGIDYRGTLEEWPDFVRQLMRTERIDHVVLFGDQRVYHRLAVEEAKALKVSVHVFEEGYLRPNYVTLERDGVNARSNMPRSRGFYRRFAKSSVQTPRPVGHVFWFAALHAAVYACAMFLGRWHYPHYQHHRDFHPIREGVFRWGLIGGLRKLIWSFRDHGRLPKFTGALSRQFYLVPLQVCTDFQVRGSQFDGVEDFIGHVVKTFAKHGQKRHHLVFKHHPLDRAYRDYTGTLTKLAKEHGLEGRIHYVADLHLPTLLQHARGTIVLNSTVGLSSLQHGTPTCALGTAVYTLARLTFERSLGHFLRNPGKVDREAVRGFCRYLARKNQLEGSFYKRSHFPSLVGDRSLPATQLRPARATGSYGSAAAPAAATRWSR